MIEMEAALTLKDNYRRKKKKVLTNTDQIYKSGKSLSKSPRQQKKFKLRKTIDKIQIKPEEKNTDLNEYHEQKDKSPTNPKQKDLGTESVNTNITVEMNNTMKHAESPGA